MAHKTRLAIVAVIFFWASAYVGIRLGLQGYSPEGLALLRYLIASVVMGAFYLNLPERSAITLLDKVLLMLVGALGIGVYNITLNYGEMGVSSGVASFITNQSPILTTVFAVLCLGEVLTAQRVLGFVVSTLGVVLIAYGEIGGFELTVSLMYVIAALLASSCYSILQKPFLKKYKAIEATTYVIWGGALFLLMYTPSSLQDVMHAPLAATVTVIYLGIFPAALAYVAWSYILRQMTVTHTVSYLNLIPFLTALMGWMVMGETPAQISVLGALIAVAGVWLVNQSYIASATPEEDVAEDDEVRASGVAN